MKIKNENKPQTYYIQETVGKFLVFFFAKANKAHVWRFQMGDKLILFFDTINSDPLGRI